MQTLPYTNVLNKTHNTNRRLWAGMIIVIVILLFIWFNTIYTQNANELQAAENIRLKTNITPEEAEDCLTYLARVSTQEQARAAARCCTASAMYCRNTSYSHSSAANRCTAKKRRPVVN